MSQEQQRRQEEATPKQDVNIIGDLSAKINESSAKTDVHEKGIPSQTSGGKVEGVEGQNTPVVALTSSTSIGRGSSSGHGITIGEALEATALTAGNRAVDYSDAAAIQAAEVRATGRTNIVPGGVAAAAQSAATRNARATEDETKTKLAEILADASSKLPADKAVTRKDAEGVIGAELRNDPNLCTRPGGVAASLAAAARINQTNNPNPQDTDTSSK